MALHLPDSPFFSSHRRGVIGVDTHLRLLDHQAAYRTLFSLAILSAIPDRCWSPSAQPLAWGTEYPIACEGERGMTQSTVRLSLLVPLLLVCLSVGASADSLTITAKQTVVRAGPDEKGAILTTTPQGATFALLETRKGWYKVLLDDGREGWVAQTAAQVQSGRGLGVAPAAGSLPGSLSGTPSTLYRQSWAVVVGVNRFHHPAITPLNYAVNDARTVAQALEPLGFPRQNVTLLLDAQAIKSEVERLLRSVMSRATGTEDRLFIFFATHGTTTALPGGGEEGYLLFHDTDLKDLGYTALSMRDLKQMSQRIPAKQILIAVDACYGGYSLVRAQAPPVVAPGYLELLARSRVIQVLTAGTKNQLVTEERDHGVFTRKLLEGLQGYADTNGDSIITGQELAAWMHPRVAQASDNKQNMQFGNLDGEGQFFFVLPSPLPAAPPRAGLGIRIGDDNLSRRLNIDGVLIIEIAEGSAAEAAGLRGTKVDDKEEVLLGDIIVGISLTEAKAGRLNIAYDQVNSADDLANALAKHRVGETVNVAIMRGTTRHIVPVRLQAVGP
jgi:hypothetical protein